MKNYRTTIILPTELYRKTKVRAAYQNKSVSGFIRDLIQGISPAREHKAPELPLGKYKLKDKGSARRQDIYGTYLANKISG